MRTPLSAFLAGVLPNHELPQMIAGDASFRRYYRVFHRGISYVVMDAPPGHENVECFAQVATAFAQAGLHVPEVIEADTDNGYLLLSDFGDLQLQPFLMAQPTQWLPLCLDTLFQLQSVGGQHILPLPDYDHMLLLSELSLFPEWFITELLQEKLSPTESSALNDLNRLLIDSAINQPQVWVHRDFHSRNLMKLGSDTSDHRIGIIDFQDAVFGAVTYDLVSILKDCYIRYPKALVREQLQYFYFRLLSADRYYQEFETFERAFDLMGLQRHLKVLGIFARLSLRDGKHSYLNDLPLVLDYVFDVLHKYLELQDYLPTFARLAHRLEQKVLQ